MPRRKSNIELLRIVSMLLIVIFHCAYKSGFSFDAGFSANAWIVKILWMVGELGVNLFMLITGYFMINGRFKWKKLAYLMCEVFFYHALLLLLGRALGCYQIAKWRQLVLSFFPGTLEQYWFVGAYLIIYILSPYLNALVHGMNRRDCKRLLLTLLLLYSILPTAFGVFFNTTEFLFYYNRLIWLIIVYLIGAYIRLYGLSAIGSAKRAAGMSAISFAVMVVSIGIIGRFSGFFARLGTREAAYFWQPNTVPMLLLSVGVFGVFLHMELPHLPIVNRIASASLGIYLLHDGVLANWLWKDALRLADHQYSPWLAARIFLAAAGIFLAGTAIDLLRQLLERWTLVRLLESSAADGLIRRAKGVADKLLD